MENIGKRDYSDSLYLCVPVSGNWEPTSKARARCWK